jgi:cytochrome c oxidase subunit 2
VNTTALVVAIAYGVALVLVAVVALAAALTARSRSPADASRLAERERAWLVVVVALLTGLLLATIFFTPYGEGAPDGSQVVNVGSFQFAFTLDPGEVRAGEPVEFRVTASDVNHGFGLYDDEDRLVFQVQALPGEVTTVVHTFDEPGSYHVLCLEFCGSRHHEMTGRLEVTG